MYSKIASDVEASSSGVRSKNYETLELTSETNTKSDDFSQRKYLYIFLGLLFTALLLAIASFGFPTKSALQASSLSDVAKACNFAQCQRTLCDPRTSPFVCLKGAAHDGCASTASAWAGNSVCDDFCDSTNCKSVQPGEDDTAKVCDKCTPDQCNGFSGKCGADSPYVCVDGSARYGCTNDKYHWPSSLNGICNVCCDLTSC